MANIVVTSTTNAIKTDMGAYYPTNIHFSKGTWKKDAITSMHLEANVIEIIVRGDDVWRVSLDGAGNSFIVDSVNGVAPSSLSDLYTKLSALIE